jgi:hypothetical protein
VRAKTPEHMGMDGTSLYKGAGTTRDPTIAGTNATMAPVRAPPNKKDRPEWSNSSPPTPPKTSAGAAKAERDREPPPAPRRTPVSRGARSSGEDGSCGSLWRPPGWIRRSTSYRQMGHNPVHATSSGRCGE